MKRKILLKVALAAVGACGFIGTANAAALGGTNTWTGAGGDFLWSNDANWSAKNCAGIAVDASKFRDGTTPCVFDFSALASGAIVTNDVSGSKIISMGFVFKANAVGDSWTLVSISGCNITSWISSKKHECKFEIPESCTLNFGLFLPINYSGEGTYTITGGGTLNFTSTSYNAFIQTIIVDNSILRIANKFSTLANCWLILKGNSAKLVLGASHSILALWSEGDGVPTVDLGSYTLTQNAGFSRSEVFPFKGVVTGSGNFTMSSGIFAAYSGVHDFTGNFTLANSDFSITNGGAFASTVNAKFNYSGRLMLENDQTLKSVTGDGVSGGVVIPASKTLTITGANGSSGTFNGRFTGAGSVSVDASGYTYELDGASAHEASVRVKAGALKLTSETESATPVAADEEVYLAFEDGLYHDYSTNGYPVALYKATVTSTAGYLGKGIQVDNGQVYTYASNIVGNVDQTISFWMNLPSFTFIPAPTYQYAYPFVRNVSWSRQTYVQFTTSRKFYFGSNTNNIGAGSCGCTAPYDLVGTGWHHYAITYSPNHYNSNGSYYSQIKIYIDGALIGQDLYCGNGMVQKAEDKVVFGLSSTKAKFDELRYVGRVWTADEVKAAYKCRESYFRQAPSELPKPVAHWAFDDADNPGKDSSGNGYDLAAPEKVTLYKYVDKVLTPYDSGTVTEPTIASKPGAYGKCAVFNAVKNDSGSALTYPNSTFPAKIPTGNKPFTISVRFQDPNQGGPSFVQWGDPTTTRANVRVCLGGSPSYVRCAVTADGSSHNSATKIDGVDFYSTDAMRTCSYMGWEGNWSHAIYVWNPSTRKMNCYFDGKNYGDKLLVSSVAGLNTLEISPMNLLVGCNPMATSWGGVRERFFGGYIDDIRIYDCSLTALQVERLVREMNPAVETVRNSVTVDAGASLEVTGWTPRPLKSLVSAGTVSVDGASRLRVQDATLGGTVNGSGEIVADGGTVTFSPTGGRFNGVLTATNGSIVATAGATNVTVQICAGGSVRGTGIAADAAIPEGYVIVTDKTKKNLPIISTSGKVTVPTVASWQIGSTAEEIGALTDREFSLAVGQLTLPSDFSQWTFSDPDLHIRYFTRSKGNGITELYARITKPRGTVILLW